MDLKTEKLKRKLEIIKNKGFIKMYSKKYINAGLLLEQELGIKENDFPVADIDGIEIKAHNIYSDNPITLFSATCDGPDLFELNKFVERFGVMDRTFNNTKVMYIKLSSTSFTEWGKYLKMKLFVDKAKRRVYIIVISYKGRLIEKRVFWSFDLLNDILNRKLNSVCLVSYRSFLKNNIRYCYFFDYKLLNNIKFDLFINELELGNIQINIKYGVYKSNYKKGKSYNHGTSFTIKKDSIMNLFEDKKNST